MDDIILLTNREIRTQDLPQQAHYLSKLRRDSVGADF